MISFSFNIDYINDTEFKSFWNSDWSTPFKHKFIELQIHTSIGLIGCNFNFTRQCDHAGLDIELTLFRRSLAFNFYDNRHWNYEMHCFDNGIEG